MTASAGFDPRLERRLRIGAIFRWVFLAATLFGLLMLVALLINLFVQGASWVSPTLFTEFHSRHPEEAGMKSAIAGSVIIVALTAVLSFPVGVGAAVYLEEYARRGRLASFISININNLAGVPSIVFGLLGLAAFSRFFGLLQPDGAMLLLLTGQPADLLGLHIDLPFDVVARLGMEVGERGGLQFRLLGLLIKLPFENSLLSGGLTMTLLSLPIVIIASREALRAVPRSIREAAFGLGATRWQVIWHQVLPVALPGILTGTILALSRAIGETAPLLILGAYTYVPFLPESVWDRFTVMPIQIYNWISLPQDDYRIHLSAAGIIVLIVILLAMNGLAIYLRNRFEKRW